MTAGTIFDRTRTPLRTWFAAASFVTAQKNGVSALGLLGLKSYEPAWAWMHKLRRAMVRPEREMLPGLVEVDESFVGGVHRGMPGVGLDKISVLIAAGTWTTTGSDGSASSRPGRPQARTGQVRPASRRPRLHHPHRRGKAAKALRRPRLQARVLHPARTRHPRAREHAGGPHGRVPAQALDRRHPAPGNLTGTAGRVSRTSVQSRPLTARGLVSEVEEEDKRDVPQERRQGDVMKHMKSGDKVALQTLRNVLERTSGRPVDFGRCSPSY